MPLYRTILCAVDFSDHSRRAFGTALDLAGRTGGRVLAVHAIDPLLAEAAAAVSDERRWKDDAAAELRTMASGLRSPSDAPGNEPAVVVLVGPPAEVILACAREHEADLIVMGTQGLGGIRKMFFGSITEKVLRETAVPVLAVTRSDPPPGAAVFTGAVAAVERDDWAASVMERAAAVASALSVPLTLVHVVPSVSTLPQYTAAVAAAEDVRRAEAATWLDREAARLRSTHEVRTMIRIGRPAEAIAAVAAEDVGQLVVIGVGGGRLLHRPGSTAYRVLTLSSAPVLAVPGEGSGF